MACINIFLSYDFDFCEITYNLYTFFLNNNSLIIKEIFNFKSNNANLEISAPSLVSTFSSFSRIVEFFINLYSIQFISICFC